MSLCDPCGRTFVEAAKLLNILKDERASLSLEARQQMDVVATSLRLTGDYLVTKQVLELGYGTPGHMKSILDLPPRADHTMGG